jgi:hypothetical protein
MKKNYTQLVKGVLLTLLSLGLVSNPVAWAQSIPDAQWARLGLTLSVTTDGNIVTSDAFPKATKSSKQARWLAPPIWQANYPLTALALVDMPTLPVLG